MPPWLITAVVGALTLLLGLGIGLANGRDTTTSVTPVAGIGADSGSPDAQSASPTATTSPVGTPTPAATESTEEAPSTTEPEESPSPSREKVKAVTKRGWAKVVKDPDAFIGDRFIVYGEVTQFDSATGKEALLADTAYRNTSESDYFDGDNTSMIGELDLLSDVVADDVFRATVTVIGSYSYDTQAGGNTTVPQVQIDKIKVIGKNE